MIVQLVPGWYWWRASPRNVGSRACGFHGRGHLVGHRAGRHLIHVEGELRGPIPDPNQHEYQVARMGDVE